MARRYFNISQNVAEINISGLQINPDEGISHISALFVLKTPDNCVLPE